MEEFKKLFLLLKEYIERQKEDITLGAVENLTKVLSALVVVGVMLLLGSITLLLAAIALAIHIGECTGSLVIGFAATAGIMLLMVLLFWLCRKQWSVQPIARLMVGIFFTQDQDRPQNKIKEE